MWECHVLLESVHVHVGNRVVHRYCDPLIKGKEEIIMTSRGQFKSREEEEEKERKGGRGEGGRREGKRSMEEGRRRREGGSVTFEPLIPHHIVQQLYHSDRINHYKVHCCSNLRRRQTHAHSSDVASFPGPAQLSVTCSNPLFHIASDRKLGGAWERG